MTSPAPIVPPDSHRKEKSEKENHEIKTLRQLDSHRKEKTEKKNPEIKTLWQLFQALAKEQGNMPPVQPVPRTGSAPFSFAQERLYELHRFETEGLVYNVSFVRRLRGTVHVPALEQGINEIIRRHEVLRTVLPSQEVMSDWERKLPVTDCRSFPEPEAEAQRIIKLEVRKPFDLQQGPFLRAGLFQLDNEDYVLLLLMHQICSDDQSKGLIMQELSTLYNAFAAGKPSPLPELPVQYMDFAHWQRQYFQGEVIDWLDRLSGRLPKLKLSNSRHNKAVLQPFEVAPKTFTALKALNKSNDVTLSMTLLAAFHTLLFSCTEQKDMLVFSSFGGRNRAEVRRLVGLFANILLLRTDMSGSPSFLQLLGRIRETMFGALLHQDMPFDKLVEMLHSETGQAPSFQVLFVLQNTSRQELRFSNVQTEQFEADSGEISQFDLVLYCKESPQGLTGLIQYREGLCEAAPYLAEVFQELLTEITAAPERRITDFPCLAQLPQDDKTDEDSPVLPETPLEAELVTIWQDILQKDTVGTNGNFFELGGNSLLAVTMFAEIEKCLGRKLPVTTLLDAPTVKQLAEVLEHDDEQCSLPSSMVPIYPRSSRPPFFYVPAGGRTALSAMQYAHHLGTDQPVYALQPLGFEKEETPHKRVEEMAAYHLQDILKVQPAGPYYIGGTCFGTRVAFELAQQLQKRGHTVALLALLDPGPPCHNSICLENMETSEKVLHHLRRTLYHCKHDPVNASAKIGYYFRKLHQHFKQGDLPASLRNKLLKRGKDDDSDHNSEETSVKLARAQNVLNAHLTALKHYMPQIYPGKITLLRSSEYHARDREGYWIRQWSEFAAGGFECRVIQGTHWDLYFQDHKFQELIETLRDCLHEAQNEEVSVNSKTEQAII